nr:hypothetical protein [Tanacetum cinerariifolium]
TRGAGIAGVSGGRLVGVVGYGGVEQKTVSESEVKVNGGKNVFRKIYSALTTVQGKRLDFGLFYALRLLLI